ncbi:MAG TPA: ABC transporter ATP-binding protein [Victivallales bacterium]|nr:ABC transporter ATP-binding protein [Victivallales bacterium]
MNLSGKDNILKVKNLSVIFKDNNNVAVNDVSFALKKGEVLAIVGESGCGKSVTCLSLVKLIDQNSISELSGEVLIKIDNNNFIDTLVATKKELRDVRNSKVSYIFQEAATSLNPVFKIGDQIAEALKITNKNHSIIEEEVIRLLNIVKIPEPDKKIYCYPHELSGGMQQRVMIAMALASKPDILVADEPTTALDVTIQSQIINLLKDIKKNHNMSILIVTHNLGLVVDFADRVLVMYAGEIVENASVVELFNNPLHPYTKSLLNAVPRLGRGKVALKTIPGVVPSILIKENKCSFRKRCELYNTINIANRLKCNSRKPSLNENSEEHYVRCHFA